MSVSEYMLFGVVVLVILGVGIGFMIFRSLNRKQLAALQDETEELRWRLLTAEAVVSQNFGIPSPKGSTPDQPSLSKAEDGIQGDTCRILGDTDDSGGQRPVSAGETGEAPLLGEAVIVACRRKRVRAVKVLGKDTRMKVRDAIEGYEEGPPVVGERYRVLTDDDTIIRTSPVVEVTLPYVRTQNSVYRIEVVERDWVKGGNGTSSEIPEGSDAQRPWLSKKSDKYHFSNCVWARRIKPDNLVAFRSEEEAQAAGYVPCKACRPSAVDPSPSPLSD
jgi:hypothetical protein